MHTKAYDKLSAFKMLSVNLHSKGQTAAVYYMILVVALGAIAAGNGEQEGQPDGRRSTT